MSRAYRIQVSESLQRVIRASDHVSTQLELLEILPQERMAELLEAELVNLGFERDGDVLKREQNGVIVEVDPKTATVTARIESESEVSLETEKSGNVYDDWGAQTRENVEASLREQAVDEMNRQADQQERQLQKELTDRLEAELRDLKGDLDQAVNRVTADALKEKAAQLGQIKELTEDRESGSLTIVLEV